MGHVHFSGNAFLGWAWRFTFLSFAAVRVNFPTEFFEAVYFDSPDHFVILGEIPGAALPVSVTVGLLSFSSSVRNSQRYLFHQVVSQFSYLFENNCFVCIDYRLIYFSNFSQHKMVGGLLLVWSQSVFHGLFLDGNSSGFDLILNWIIVWTNERTLFDTLKSVY